MNLINLECLFEVNDYLEIKEENKSWGKLLIVDNFWKDYKKIREEALKIPCIKLPGVYSSPDNGKKYFDGRSQFVFYTVPKFSEVIYHLSIQYFNQNPEKLLLKWDNPFILFNNVFQMYDVKYNKHKTHHYGPHIDGESHIAAIWYMNDDYEDNEGTGIYNKVENPTSSPWCKGSKLIDTIPAKSNRLVMYKGNIPHAQLVTKRWFNEPRLSMVQFLWSP